MDENDLKLTDPKRVGLENDRIVLEFAVNQLRSYYIQINEPLSNLVENGNDHLVKAVYQFKLRQLNLLQKIISVFEDTYMRLIKEDSL